MVVSNSSWNPKTLQKCSYFPINNSGFDLNNKKKKGRDLTQFNDKSPHTHRKIQKATWQHKNATYIFDHTTIADRLKTDSLSNNSQLTGVVKRALRGANQGIASKDKKEEIWLSPMTKAPTPTEMSKGQSDNTNNATKKFD